MPDKPKPTTFDLTATPDGKWRLEVGNHAYIDFSSMADAKRQRDELKRRLAEAGPQKTKDV